MAEIIISIVGKVAEFLVGPAIREGKYFLCVSKVIKDLEDEKKELISEKNNLQDRVEQAKERTELIEEPVEKWLNDVKNLLDEIADLERRMRANISCFQGRCPTWRRYRLCKQMVEKIEAMGKFKGKSSNIQPFSHRAPLPGIQYQSSESFSYFESTKVAYNQLMEAIQDDCNYIIGVYGMGGCGKTTLVTEVGKKAEESKMFDKVMLVTVSQTPNIRDIQGKMAEMLNLKLEEEYEETRAQRLWLSLKEKKRILLIVDDLWRKFNLVEIGIPLDNVNRGAWKILITTRDQRVCTSMDCQKSIHVGLLSKDESWTLFQKHAKIDDKFSKSLDGVPQKLCDECKGLLIAIVSVGSSLKGRHNNDWELALDKLRDSDAFDDHEEGVRAALRCLKLSYDYLEDTEAKLLFLMCSMFPEDYNIPMEDLTRLAIGLGVGGRSSIKSRRSLIQAGINKLLDSCVLMHSLPYWKDCVKMHDMVRDAALWIAKKLENRKILVNVDKPLNTLVENDSLRDCFVVSSWHNEILTFPQLHIPNLEMLLLNQNYFDLSHLTFEGIQRIKAFSLTVVRGDPLNGVPLSLPPSTQLLTNVQTLRLKGLRLGDISIIASLTRLEVLDLQGCGFNELPDEIGKLKRLKLLDLSNCGILQKNYNGAIGKCSELEELYASYMSKPEEYLSQSIVDIVTLPKLQRFVIGVIPNTMPYYLRSSMRFLEARDFNIFKLRASEENNLHIAEVVSLKGLHGGCKNIVPDVIGVMGAMNDLNTLYLCECLEIECIFNTSATSDSKVDDLIPRLVNLGIIQMENLKELCRGPSLQVLHFFEKIKLLYIKCCMSLHSIFPRECNLQNLRWLTIQECNSVEVLLSTPAVRSLQQLEHLVILGCDVLKHIIASGTEHGCNTSQEIVSAPTSSHLPMPNLKYVRIGGCPKLELIFPMCYVEGLPRVEEMYIENAPELKYVFDECDHEHHSSHQYENHIMLPHLQVLQLSDLQNLFGMCPEYCHAKWPSQSLKDIFVGCCPKLATSWITVMVGSDQRQHPLDENLPAALPRLNLYGLPQLNFLPWVSPTPGQIWSLHCLRRLCVTDCEKLKSLFSMEVCRSLPELMSLSIGNCPELEQIVAANELIQLSNAEVYFPKLYYICIADCNKLKSLFPVAMVRMLPQLKILHILKATQLEEVFSHNSGDDPIDEMEIVLPNLTEITLEDLPSFVDICHGCELHAVELQDLCIDGCPKTSPSLRAMQANEEEDEDSLDDVELSDTSIDDLEERPDNINEDVQSDSSIN